MQIVHVLVPANGVHVGVQSLVGPESVPGQCHALPFGQGVHDLHFALYVHCVKVHRPFHAVQVVVQAGTFFHK